MPAAKKPSDTPKAMDIHTPATAPATPASKPVIVPSRSLAGDPMLSGKSTSSSEDEQPSGSPVINRQAKTIAPISEPTESAPSETPEAAQVVAAETTKTSEASEQNEVAEPPDLTAPAPESAASTEGVTSPTPGQTPVADTATLSTDESEDDEEDAETGTAVQEKTAEQMRADQLEELIAKGNYAVPLNRKHNRRMNAMLAIVFVLFIALITLDLLLDMEVLTLSGFPHTDLLAP